MMEQSGDPLVPSVPDYEKQASYELTDKTMLPPNNGELPHDYKPIEKVYCFNDADLCARNNLSTDNPELGFVLYNVLSPSECAYYMAVAEREGMEPVWKGEREGLAGYRRDYRDNDRAVIRSPEVSELIWQRIKPHIKDVRIDVETQDKAAERQRVGRTHRFEGEWQALGLNDVWRLNRYQPGGHFAPHYDGFFVRSPNERSMKTFMLYLNGVGPDASTQYLGGTTNFVNDDQPLFKDDTGIYRAQAEHIFHKVVPVPGMALVFNHRILHEGERVTQGLKYIMRTDVMFKRVGTTEYDPKEAQALLYLQQAETAETDGLSLEAAALYRKAFRLWPPLEDSMSYCSRGY